MILNVLAVIIFAVCVIVNVKSGFVKSVLGIFSFFLAFVIVAGFGDGFAEAVRETDTGRAVESKIYNITYEQLYSSAATSTAEAVEELNLPKFIKKNAIETCENLTVNVYDEISDTVSRQLFGIIAHVVLFLLLTLIFAVAKLIIPTVFKLPVLKQVNKMLGLGIGIVNGLICVYIFMLAVSVIVNIGSWQALNEAAQSSVIYRFIFENNAMLKLFA